MKQLLRRINGWRFEAPLALVLGVAAGFAAMAMPRPLFAQLPVLGDHGDTGQMALAALMALLAAGIGYAAMRVAGKPAARAQPEADQDIDFDFPEEEREPVSVDRLRRVRRADAHPDAPPRAPIIASRDLGEPFMEVGAPLAAPKPEPVMTIPDGEFVEVAHADVSEEVASDGGASDGAVHVEPASASLLDEGVEWSDPVPVGALASRAASGEAPTPVGMMADVPEPEIETLAEAGPIPAMDAEPEPVETSPPVMIAPVVADLPAQADPAPISATVPPKAGPVPISRTPISPTHAAPIRPTRESLAAMMDRLSAGLERRAAAQERAPASAAATLPERDMRPALRDALEELNRIASARHG